MMVFPLLKLCKEKTPLIDEDGISHVIFTIRSKDGERKYVVEAKNGKFYHSVIVVLVRYVESGKSYIIL